MASLRVDTPVAVVTAGDGDVLAAPVAVSAKDLPLTELAAKYSDNEIQSGLRSITEEATKKVADVIKQLREQFGPAADVLLPIIRQHLATITEKVQKDIMPVVLDTFKEVTIRTSEVVAQAVAQAVVQGIVSAIKPTGAAQGGCKSKAKKSRASALRLDKMSRRVRKAYEKACNVFTPDELEAILKAIAVCRSIAFMFSSHAMWCADEMGGDGATANAILRAALVARRRSIEMDDASDVSPMPATNTKVAEPALDDVPLPYAGVTSNVVPNAPPPPAFGGNILRATSAPVPSRVDVVMEADRAMRIAAAEAGVASPPNAGRTLVDQTADALQRVSPVPPSAIARVGQAKAAEAAGAVSDAAAYIEPERAVAPGAARRTLGNLFSAFTRNNDQAGAALKAQGSRVLDASGDAATRAATGVIDQAGTAAGGAAADLITRGASGLAGAAGARFNPTPEQRAARTEANRAQEEINARKRADKLVADRQRAELELARKKQRDEAKLALDAQRATTRDADRKAKAERDAATRAARAERDAAMRAERQRKEARKRADTAARKTAQQAAKQLKTKAPMSAPANTLMPLQCGRPLPRHHSDRLTRQYVRFIHDPKTREVALGLRAYYEDEYFAICKGDGLSRLLMTLLAVPYNDLWMYAREHARAAHIKSKHARSMPTGDELDDKYKAATAMDVLIRSVPRDGDREDAIRTLVLYGFSTVTEFDLAMASASQRQVNAAVEKVVAWIVLNQEALQVDVAKVLAADRSGLVAGITASHAENPSALSVLRPASDVLNTMLTKDPAYQADALPRAAASWMVTWATTDQEDDEPLAWPLSKGGVWQYTWYMTSVLTNLMALADAVAARVAIDTATRVLKK